MQRLRPLLSRGDRRSVAQSNRARAIVERSPERVAELAQLANDSDWLVAVRTLDLLEKIAHDHADWVKPHQRLFIGPLANSEQWEFHLQIVRALPLFQWTRQEKRRVYEVLHRDLRHPQKFVRAWALDSLAQFARRDPALAPEVMRGLADFERSGSKALETRARHIRAHYQLD
jgi:hypothetical protein